MNRTTYLFSGAIIAAAVMVCMGAKVYTVGGGSSTLTSGQFNANQFSVSGGVVFDKVAGIETNRLFWGDAGAVNIDLRTAAGGAPRIGFSPNGVNRFTLGHDGTEDTFYIIQANAVQPFTIWYGGNAAFIAGVSVASLTNAGTSVFQGNVTMNSTLTMNATDINAVHFLDATGLTVSGGDGGSTIAGALAIGDATHTVTNLALFDLVTNAPALAAWRTNSRRMTLEADFLLSPDATHAAGVTLTVELAGSFTNVWKRTAPAAIGAETVGMTHRIQPGARYQFTDSSASPATAAFVARAYSEIYE
jgi:hypothetical protein